MQQIEGTYKTSILLVCFLIGISPIDFLIKFNQSVFFKLMEYKNSENPGNHNVTVLEGINIFHQKDPVKKE